MTQGEGKNHVTTSRPAARLRRLSAGGSDTTVRTLLLRTRDMLLPPQCANCRATVDTDDVLCPRCWPDLRMIARPICDICGVPFAHGQLSTICAECARKTPPFTRARSAVIYDDASRGLVIGFKHSDRMEIAGLFVRWMTTAGERLTGDADVIVPVPLHPGRLFHRRFNQAAVLADGIGKRTGLPVVRDALERIKPSPPPGKASPAERRRAVAGAFRVREDRRDAIAGRRVLLVDDVMTTGATARAATRKLRAAKAAAVDVLTVARAVRE